MSSTDTKPEFQAYEYRVVPVHGFRYRPEMRRGNRDSWGPLPMAWDEKFYFEEQAIQACKGHAKARLDGYEFLNQPVKYLGAL